MRRVINIYEAIRDLRAKWEGEGASREEIEEYIKRFKLLKDTLLKDHKEIMTTEDRDVNRLQKLSFWEFRRRINDLEEEYREKVQPLKNQAKEKDTRIIYKNEACVVYEVYSKAAMCNMGRDSDWCVSKENLKYYDEYSSQDIMFRVIEANVDISERFDRRDFMRMEKDKIDMSKIAIAFKERDKSPTQYGVYMEAFDLKNNALNMSGILKVVRFFKMPIDVIYGVEEVGGA